MALCKCFIRMPALLREGKCSAVGWRQESRLSTSLNMSRVPRTVVFQSHDIKIHIQVYHQ